MSLLLIFIPASVFFVLERRSRKENVKGKDEGFLLERKVRSFQDM